MTRNYKLYRNGHWATFGFERLKQQRFFLKYSTLILNGIAVSAQCVSSMSVVSTRRIQQSAVSHAETREIKDNDAFSKVEHRHNDPVSHLDYACSLRYRVRYDAISEKHPFTSCPTAKHPKHSKLSVSNIQEKPAIFFIASKQSSTKAPQ